MSSGLASLIAQVAFFSVAVYGRATDDLSTRAIIVFVALWAAGYILTGTIDYGSLFFTSYIAILDIVLVLMVFKGDIRLT